MASLPTSAHLKDECRVLEKDSYVYDLDRKLDKIIGGIEEILNAGGFFLKPWVSSGQSGRGKELQQTC